MRGGEMRDMYIRKQDAIDSIEDSIGLIDRALCDMDIPLCDERKMLERERKSLSSLRDDIKEIPAADVVDRTAYDQLLDENAKLRKQVSSLRYKIRSMKSDSSWDEDIRRGQVQGMW